MPTPITIRPVVEEDRPFWLALWLGYQAFYRETIPEAATEATWRRLLDPVEPVEGALALAGAEPVGFVHYLFHRSTWTVQDNCYLQDLFVSPATRGQGAGRRLIEHVFDAARRRGVPRVYWLTHETNGTARRLYDTLAENAGFVEYARVP